MDNLSEMYEEMMDLFNQIKVIVKKRNPHRFEQWKAYGFELDGTFVSMGPNLGDIVEELDGESEEESEEEDEDEN